MKKVIAVISLSVLSVALIWCGTQKDTIVIPAPPVPPVSVTCNGTPVGVTRSILCEDPKQIGAITQVCDASGKWQVAKDDCRVLPDVCDDKSATKVTFVKDVKPLIEKRCISCHKAIDLDEYKSAKSYLTEIISRTEENASDTKRMPPSGAALDKAERNIFTQWKADGFLNDNECIDPDDQASLGFIDRDTINTFAIADLSGLSAKSKGNTRWLDTSSRINLGSSDEEKQTYRDAVNKALNSLSKERDLVPCTESDPIKALCRIDLDAYGWTPADWDLIVANAALVIEDKTDKGEFIKQQTNTKIPILGGDQFVRAALDFKLAERQRTAKVGEVIVNPYYAILGIAADEKTYLATKGVDLQKIFDDFEAICAGNNLSPISLLKNRLVCVVDSDDGDCSISFDPLLAIGKSNLFQNPFVFVKSDKIFDFQASEVICTARNGLHEYSLFNSAGVRQDAAPETIVKNPNAPGGDSEIRLRVCSECHSKGLINVIDELRDSILGKNFKNFNRDEIDFTRLLIGPQGSIDSRLALHNKRFKDNQSRIGVDVDKPDPINYVVNRYVKQWTLNEVCAVIKIPLADCKLQIEQSAILSQTVGALTNGGTISFDLLVDTNQVFIDDLRLGQEPLERQ